MHFHLQLQNKYTINFFFGFAIIIIRLNEQRKYLKHVKKKPKKKQNNRDDKKLSIYMYNSRHQQQVCTIIWKMDT